MYESLVFVPPVHETLSVEKDALVGMVVVDGNLWQVINMSGAKVLIKAVPTKSIHSDILNVIHSQSFDLTV